MRVRRWIRARRERGQTLIIIAVALVGLLALAGLAIDGGNLFMKRRRAQNAADAGALAGTRLVSLAIMTCDPIDMPALDARVARVVNEYAEQNGISDTNGVARWARCP
jgi:Flp pilus assembly protein TadG